MMERKPIQTLLVEDNPGDAHLIQELLAEPPGDFALVRVDLLAAALERVGSAPPDVVLLDLGLPDAQGLEGLRAMQQRASRLPIIVLTGLDDREVVSIAVESGAQDYLIKGQIDGNYLARAIRYAIGRKYSDEALRTTLEELEKRNQELESFTYSISHDLKEPLRTLEAFSQFVLEDYSDRLDEHGRDYLTRMSKAAARLRQMIEELLVLSHLSRRPDELSRIDVAELVNDIRTAFQAALDEKGGHIEVASSLPSVLGDHGRVEQIFGNLIANGLKFNQSGAPIVSIGVRDTADGNQAVFFVRDNGIGIDPQYSDKIFGVFQRLQRREDYEGTGAGLAIVKRAAEALGGSVRLEESAPGAGATFLVTLPLWREAALGSNGAPVRSMSLSSREGKSRGNEGVIAWG
jgi:signal transduction histidine kinase